MSKEQKDALREELGLNRPTLERYFQWVKQIARGDFGVSFTSFGQGDLVINILKAVLPATVLVFGLGTLLAFILGEWLGRFLGWRRPDLLTGGITFSAIALYTSFPPWLAFLLTYFLVRRLGLVQNYFNRLYWNTSPISWGEATARMSTSLILVCLGIWGASAILQKVTRRSLPILLWIILGGLAWVGTWWISGMMNQAVEVVKLSILPLIAYISLSFGEIMLIMRTSMADTLHEEYIQTARAKGLPDRIVRDRHAARNAVLPVISRLVTTLPYLLTGMVMIEDALDWNGLGTVLFTAVGQQNINLAVGIALIIGAFSLVARIILDILHAALDPRLRKAPETTRMA